MLLVGTALIPMQLANWFSVAAFQLALGALALLGRVDRGALPVRRCKLWLVRVPVVPVTTLLVAACLFAAVFGGGRDVHGIVFRVPGCRSGTASTPPSRAGWGSGEEWPVIGDLTDGTSFPVRPLSAEGGGGPGVPTGPPPSSTSCTPPPTRWARPTARAPSSRRGQRWLGRAGDRLGDGPGSRRARRSGGDQGTAGPRRRVRRLVLRDTVYTATRACSCASRTATHAPDDGEPVWSDRATLMDVSWAEPDALATSTTRTSSICVSWADWGQTGVLVLNSTSSTTMCAL